MSNSKLAVALAATGVAVLACKCFIRSSDTIILEESTANVCPMPTLGRASCEQTPSEGVWVYFGSQSGTAEQFSEDLKDASGEYGLRVKVVDLEEFDEDVFAQHRCVVLIVATYGEGDPTDNAEEQVVAGWVPPLGHAAGHVVRRDGPGESPVCEI